MDKVTLNDVLDITEYAEEACEKAEDLHGISAESMYSDVVQKGVATYILGTLHLYRTTAVQHARHEVDELVKELVDRHEGMGRFPFVNYDSDYPTHCLEEDLAKAGLELEFDGFRNTYIRLNGLDDLFRISEAIGMEACVEVEDGTRKVVIGLGGC